MKLRNKTKKLLSIIGITLVIISAFLYQNYLLSIEQTKNTRQKDIIEHQQQKVKELVEVIDLSQKLISSQEKLNIFLETVLNELLKQAEESKPRNFNKNA